jgi:lipopolysaccharide transport system permease protein
MVALFNLTVSSAAFLMGYLLFLGIPPAASLLLPVILLPLLLATVGLAWFLSALGVYLRDIQQLVPVLITILMYLNPIFYSREQMPQGLAAVLQFSPLALAIEDARLALFWGRLPAWGPLAAHFVFAWGIAWLGLMWFSKTRKGFADVV